MYLKKGTEAMSNYLDQHDHKTVWTESLSKVAEINLEDIPL